LVQTKSALVPYRNTWTWRYESRFCFDDTYKSFCDCNSLQILHFFANIDTALWDWMKKKQEMIMVQKSQTFKCMVNTGANSKPKIKTLHNRRCTKLQFTSSNKLRCGLNFLPNHFKTITNRIDVSWLTLAKETYKMRCKKEFITNPLLTC
jgi:hypothetical protein